MTTVMVRDVICNLLSLHHRTRVGLCMQRQKKYINDLRVKSLVTCDEMEIFLFCLLMHPRSHRWFWTRVRVHPSSRRETNRQYAFSCLLRTFVLVVVGIEKYESASVHLVIVVQNTPPTRKMLNSNDVLKFLINLHSRIAP